MIEEKIAPDFRTGMDVDTRHEPCKMVYQPCQEIHMSKKQPVRDAVIANRP